MNSKDKLWLSEIIGDADESGEQLVETLLPILRDSSHVIDSARARGVKSCCWCKKSLQHVEPGVLFDCGELVCFGCIPTWWAHRCPELSVAEREPIERKLVQWLLKHHGAKVAAEPDKLPDTHRHAFRIVAACDDCHGTGARKGRRCRTCDGRGTIWVVVRKKGERAALLKMFSGRLTAKSV